MTDDPRDPGWGPALGQALRRLVPVRRFEGGTLILLRTLFLAFLIAPAFILLLLLFIGESEPGFSTTLALAILIAIAAVNTSIIGVIRNLPLKGSSAAEIAGGYRSTMFIRVALAEMIALVGFVLFFVTGSLTTYLAGYLLSLAGYAMSAPTAGDIARYQEGLNSRGVSVDLLGTLTGGPPPGAR